MPLRPVPLFWRTVVLRVLLGSAMICLISSIVSCLQGRSDIWAGAAVTMYIPPSFIVPHHVLRLWPRRRWLEIGEILCSLAEIGGCVFAMYYLWANWIVISRDYTGDLALGVSWSILGVSASAAFFILLWDAAINHGKNLLRRYDFSAGLGSGHPGSQWCFIFGSFTTRKRFKTDTRFIRWFRGGLAILCLVALLLMMFYVFIGQPLWWGRQSVIRTSKVHVGAVVDAVPDAETRVIMDVSDMQRLQQNISLSILNVTATLSYTLDSSGRSRRGRWPVVIRPAQRKAFQLPECHNATHWPQEESLLIVSCPLVMYDDEPEKRYHLTLPLTADLEILITVDLSTIANTSQEPFKIGLYPLLIGSAQYTPPGTEPIYLNPGSHLYASSSVVYIERSQNKGLVALGVREYRLLPVLNVGHLFPERPSSVPENNNTASLRLFIPYTPKVQVEREYSEDSVLNGFALVGGIWTFVNSLFVSVFGTTLLLVLFGIKPLSVYGLAHLFQSKEDSLIPRKLSPEDRDCIIAVLSEYLLDDDMKPNHKPEPGSPDHSNNGAETEGTKEEGAGEHA